MAASSSVDRVSKLIGKVGVARDRIGEMLQEVVNGPIIKDITQNMDLIRGRVEMRFKECRKIHIAASKGIVRCGSRGSQATARRKDACKTLKKILSSWQKR